MREWLAILFAGWKPHLQRRMGVAAEILGRMTRWVLLHDVPISIIQLAGIGMVAKGVAMISGAAAWIILGLFALFVTIWRGSDV